MIVTMRQGIGPVCTTHLGPMKLHKFGEPTGLTVSAYKCEEVSCTRAYNTSMGYFDIVNDRFVLLEKEQQDCDVDETRMFLEQVSSDSEVWRCGQIGCDAARVFKRQNSRAQGV